MTRVCVDTPSGLETQLPLVAVVRYGGGDHTSPVVDRATVELATFHSTRNDASNLARRAHSLMRTVLPGQQVAGVTVNRVQTVTVPVHRPYDNPAVFRYVADYRLFVHNPTP